MSNSTTVVLVTDNVKNDPNALDALKNKIGSFQSIYLTSFEELMEPLYNYADDIDYFMKLANSRLGSSTSIGASIYDRMGSIDYVAVTYEESHHDGESGTDGAWYLDNFLMPRVEAATNTRVQILTWHEDGEYWA